MLFVRYLTLMHYGENNVSIRFEIKYHAQLYLFMKNVLYLHLQAAMQNYYIDNY